MHVFSRNVVHLALDPIDSLTSHRVQINLEHLSKRWKEEVNLLD